MKLQVEGKGYGFAHVGSSKGFKEINRYNCSDPTVVMPPYRIQISRARFVLEHIEHFNIRAIRQLDGYYLKDRALNVEIR